MSITILVSVTGHVALSGTQNYLALTFIQYFLYLHQVPQWVLVLSLEG